VRQLTCLDLFCGCGGFSLGMERAGFRVLAALDNNSEATDTFRANFSKDTQVFCKDITKFAPDKLAAKLGVNHVDVIVGGPPCQGYSTVRQSGSANHGSRVRRDKRRYLYRYFLDYVAAFRPSVFVMENVMGIQSAAKGKFFTLVQADARKLGYRVHAQAEEAWKLGVPQKRRRQLIIGVRNEVPGYFPNELKPAGRAPNNPKLWDAIGDLPPLGAGEGTEERDYDLDQRKVFLATRGEVAREYLGSVLEVAEAGKLTSHRARPHSERDLRDFARMREGETADQTIERGEPMEFPYNRKVFLDRYTRQHRDRLCSTIVAHLAKDGLMFIHPIQNRTLTPREAARVQTFPDWFRFPVARTHQYRIIGNAVPPLVAEAIGNGVKEFLNESSKRSEATETSREGKRRPSTPSPVRTEAAYELQRLAELDRRGLRGLPREQFLHGWQALLTLFPNLHPDNALNHGDHIEEVSPDQFALPGFEELLSRRYTRTGWPVALELIGSEAWRRFHSGEFTQAQLYCADALGEEPLRSTAGGSRGVTVERKM
jgi:DNA (cytosine-5)-methyltransferase 1